MQRNNSEITISTVLTNLQNLQGTLEQQLQSNTPEFTVMKREIEQRFNELNSINQENNQLKDPKKNESVLYDIIHYSAFLSWYYEKIQAKEIHARNKGENNDLGSSGILKKLKEARDSITALLQSSQFKDNKGLQLEHSITSLLVKMRETMTNLIATLSGKMEKTVEKGSEKLKLFFKNEQTDSAKKQNNTPGTGNTPRSTRK